MRQVDPHVAGHHLRIVEHLAQRVDRTGRHADLLELFRKLGLGELLGQFEQARDQRVAIDHARGVGLVALVLAIAGSPSTCIILANWPSLPQAISIQPSVVGKRLVGHHAGMRVAHPHRRLAGDEIVGRLVGEHADHRVHQRHVDVAALAGVLALLQRGADRQRRIDAGEHVREGDAKPRRLAVRIAGDVHDAAHALHQQIVAGAGLVRAVLAEAGDRAVDQPRVLRRQALVVEAVLGEPAELEILDHHVGARRELLDDALAVRRLEVDRDRALAAVAGEIVGRAETAAVLVLHEGRAPAAGVVARAGALDLDHVGAEIGERLAGPGTGEDAGKLEHANARERALLRTGHIDRFLPDDSEQRLLAAL